MAALIAAFFTAPSLRAECWSLVYLTTTVIIVAGAFRNASSRKAPWLLLAAACLCFGLAHLNRFLGVLPGQQAPGLTFDIEYVMSVARSPLVAGGLALFARARSPGGDRQSLIDAITVTVGLAVMIWLFRILPGLLDPAISAEQKLLIAGFPAGDVLIILALARLLSPGTVASPPLLLISAGTVLGTLSDVLYGLVRVNGAGQAPWLIGVGWTVCFVACGSAALHPTMRELTLPAPRRVAEASTARLVLLSATALAPPVLLSYLAFADRDRREGLIAATTGVVYVAVLARLWTVNVSHRRGLLRERELRMAGASLASARSVGNISAVVQSTAAALIGFQSRHEALFAVRSGEELRIVPPSPGEPADTGAPVISEIAQLADAWLPRLWNLTSTEPQYVPVTQLDPDLQAAAQRAGYYYEGILLCPLMLTDRPTGDPLIGLLAVVGAQRILVDLKGALGIFASQVALAVERVVLTQELIRQRGEALFRTLVQDTSDVILILDDELKVRYATPSAVDIFGEMPAPGMPATSLTEENDRLTDDLTLDQPTAGGAAGEAGSRCDGQDPFSGLWRIRRDDGRSLLLEVRYNDRREDPTVGGHVLTIRDVTEQRQLEDELKHRVFHDALTSLPNRVLFADRAAHGLALARRNATIAAVLFVDLDDFKIINDTMGHGVGDELLAAVAGRLASVARASDTAARLGGDEFALLIENLADASAIEGFADRVVTAFSEPFQLSAGSVLTTVTVGIATSDDSNDTDQLLRHADLALYAAKSAGKRRWHRYAPTLSAGMLRRREMQAALEEAVAKSAFELAYQPIVRLADGHITGLEALLRWPHPSLGMLMPGQFIDIAEETGQIIPLGSWVLRQAITSLAQWRGPDPDPRQPFVSVNVTARQFRDLGFVANVRRLLDDTGLVPSALMLELTESGLLRRDERINSDLAELRHIGVRLAIDDFGTGYSSLSYLRELPIEVLKIDKSFVEGIAASDQRLALVRGIVEIARTLNIQVIAEGIETEEQRALLTAMGCRYGQGYLLAVPMPWDQVQVVLRSGQGLVPDIPPRRSTFLGAHATPPDPRLRLPRGSLGDPGGPPAGAQRGEQHLGGKAGADAFPRAQPEVKQRL
jgi:diguanylate cyclase (GGDEF)-like protein